MSSPRTEIHMNGRAAAWWVEDASTFGAFVVLPAIVLVLDHTVRLFNDFLSFTCEPEKGPAARKKSDTWRSLYPSASDSYMNDLTPNHCIYFRIVPPLAASTEERYLWDAQRNSSLLSSDESETKLLAAKSDLPDLQLTTESGNETESQGPASPTTPTKASTDQYLSPSGLDTEPYSSSGDRRKGSVDEVRLRRHHARGASTVKSNIEARPAHLTNLQAQTYTLFMDIYDPTTNATLPFCLRVDIASSLSWVRSEPCLQLSESSRTEVSPWTEHQHLIAPEHNCITLPGLNLDQPIDMGMLTALGTPCTVLYADRCQAHMVFVRNLKCQLRCYESDRAHKASRDIPFLLGMGIAYAQNERLYLDPTEGVLGLSCDDMQTDFDGKLLGPSFIHQIRNKIEYTGTEDPRTERVVMYLTIRLRPDFYRNLSQDVHSWVAFNRWPTEDKPEFSDKIWHHTNGRKAGHWSVRLVSMEFVPCRYPDESPQAAVQPYPGCHFDFRNNGEGGLEVVINSRHSTSTLPRFVIEGIHHNLFGRNGPLEEVLVHGEESWETYTVPHLWPPHNTRIRYTFSKAGNYDSETVVVYGPTYPFLFAQIANIAPSATERHTGLIRVSANDKEASFGLNFLQSMITSFHWSIGGAHFMRMAPQWPESHLKYSLPE